MSIKRYQIDTEKLCTIDGVLHRYGNIVTVKHSFWGDDKIIKKEPYLVRVQNAGELLKTCMVLSYDELRELVDEK